MAKQTEGIKEIKSNPDLPATIPTSPVPTTTPQVLFPDINFIESFVDKIATSSLAKNFRYKDKDGNEQINRGDIISCVALGYELGISPMASLSLGSRLNADAYFSVKKGASMGLDPVTSISKIYNIETKNGKVLYAAVDVISAAILRAGVQIDILNDFTPAPLFYDMITGSYVGHYFELFKDDELNPLMYLYIDGSTTPDQIKGAKDGGKIIIKRANPITYTKVTSVKLTRKIGKDSKSITIHYSLQQATDAGLYKGYHSTDKDASGKPIWTDGKSNWNSHPQTMLRNRALSIGGRIIVADVLGGIYTEDEARDLVDGTIIENATVVEE